MTCTEKTGPFDISVLALSHAKEDADARSDKKSNHVHQVTVSL